MSNKRSSSGEAVWARQRLPQRGANRGVEQPLWHQAESINDTAIRTACQRFFVFPLDMRSDVPDSDSTCRVCYGKAAEDRLPVAQPRGQR